MAEAATPDVTLKGAPWMQAQLLEVDIALDVEGAAFSVLRLDITKEGVVNCTYNIPHNATYPQVKKLANPHIINNHDHEIL
jgi:hypothetical protein